MTGQQVYAAHIPIINRKGHIVIDREADDVPNMQRLIQDNPEVYEHHTNFNQMSEGFTDWLSTKAVSMTSTLFYKNEAGQQAHQVANAFADATMVFHDAYMNDALTKAYMAQTWVEDDNARVKRFSDLAFDQEFILLDAPQAIEIIDEVYQYNDDFIAINHNLRSLYSQIVRNDVSLLLGSFFMHREQRILHMTEAMPLPIHFILEDSRFLYKTTFTSPSAYSSIHMEQTAENLSQISREQSMRTLGMFCIVK